MNREEKKEMLNDFCKFISNKGDYTEAINDYLNSKEMNREKAIEVLENSIDYQKEMIYSEKLEYKALQFAIDYMKDEGEIIGWVNYYPESVFKCGSCYNTIEDAKRGAINEYHIQIPIKKPK